LGRAQAILPHDEQVNSERYRKGQRVKVFILSVRSAPKGPEILVSRSHRNMLRRLFEIEVPEVHNGVVEIKAIAREAGFRSKVAVSATQAGIDPVGSCIGIRGNRIQSIVNELQGEKIDIVSWDSDPRSFIANSLSPSEPVQVELLDAEQTAVVVVPDRQLSLAIGKEGQNTRLAARLTGWRLDIKGMTEWEEIREARLHAAAEASARAAEEAASLAAAQAEAVAEATEIIETEEAPAPAVVAEAEAIVEEVSEALEIAERAEAEEQEAVVEAIANNVDEDSILETLLREEELLRQAEVEAGPVGNEASVGISVDDLSAFTLDDVGVMDDEDDEEVEDEPMDFSELPVLTPDAGKIRFAEDIVEENRGGGRRGGGGRARRGGGGGGSRRR
jgi:transcription antitermination factor NusA-like protein